MLELFEGPLRAAPSLSFFSPFCSSLLLKSFFANTGIIRERLKLCGGFSVRFQKQDRRVPLEEEEEEKKVA